MTGNVKFSKFLTVSLFLCNLFSAGAGGAFGADLDYQTAYDAYLDAKRDSDASYQDYLTQKGIYDSAVSEQSTADSNVRTQEQNVRNANAQLDGIDRQITQTESQRSSAIGEIDRIAIQIGSVDNQLASEQTNLDKLQRTRDQTQRKLDQVERRIRDLERTDNGSDWTCVWVDRGTEEHRGGHRATDSDRGKANKAAQEECEKVHGSCVSNGCSQPDNNEVRRLKRERDDLEQDLRNLDSQIQTSRSRTQSLENDRSSLVNQDLDCRNRIRNYDTTLAQLGRDRDRADRALSSAESELQTARTEASQARKYVQQVTPAYQSARALSDRESAITAAALQHYKDVLANYNAALNQVLAAADADATKEAEREAEERGIANGEAAGDTDGSNRGREKAFADIAGRDQADGYLQGRADATLLSSFAADYQTGMTQGQQHADKKAAEEDFAKGFNEAFATLLANPPASSATLDAAVDTSQETAGSGTFLSATSMKVGSVAPPSAAGPAKPVLTPPTASVPQVTAVASVKKYYDPNCQNLVLSEFEPKCLNQYANTFQKAFASKYEATYKPRYVAKFNASAAASYKSFSGGKDTAALEKGQKLGVLHRGLLDGYGNRLADAQREQTKLGREYLDAYLEKGALLVVRSASLDDNSGDGLLSPGEKAGVSFVVDNYGKQSTRKAAVDFQLLSTEGLTDGKSSEWLAIPPSTRLTLKNAYSASVVSSVAGNKLRAEGNVVRDGTEALARLTAEGKVGFAYQLDKVELEKTPKVGEKIKAKFVFSNQTSANLPETQVGLRNSPAYVDIEAPATAFKIPALVPGQTAEIVANVKAKNYVGDNTDVQFWSDVGTSPITSQLFPKRVLVDRTAGLLLFDSSGKPVPDSTIKVAAGSQLTVNVQLKYNRTTNLPGPFKISAGVTSDKGITIVSNTASSVDFGGWWAGRQATLQPFRFNIPASLKGKRGYVMINLSEGANWLHLMTVYLDIQ